MIKTFIHWWKLRGWSVEEAYKSNGWIVTYKGKDQVQMGIYQKYQDAWQDIYKFHNIPWRNDE